MGVKRELLGVFQCGARLCFDEALPLLNDISAVVVFATSGDFCVVCHRLLIRALASTYSVVNLAT